MADVVDALAEGGHKGWVHLVVGLLHGFGRDFELIGGEGDLVETGRELGDGLVATLTNFVDDGADLVAALGVMDQFAFEIELLDKVGPDLIKAGLTGINDI